MTESDRFMGTAEVAALFNRSRSAVHEWVRRGLVPEYAKPFRMHSQQRGLLWCRRAIDKWIEERRGGGR